MQRNVLYKNAAAFLSIMTVLLLLGGCESSPKTGGHEPPVPTLPSGQPGFSSTNQANAMKSKVALLLPMTGRGSDAGQAMLNAAQLAMADLGANTFELIPGDTGASAQAAAQDALKNGAKLILGPLFAADAKTIAPIAQSTGVNIVSFSTDASAAGPNTFILGFLPQSQVHAVIDYATAHNIKRIALIAPKDAFGNAVAASFASEMQSRSLPPSGNLRYDGAQPSADTIRQFSAASPFDAVLIAANPAASSLIAQNLPPQIQKLGTGLWEQTGSAKYPGLQGAWYAASSPQQRARFENKYRQTYGENPPRLASLAYDAAALAIVLAKQGQGFGKNALSNPNGFSGVDGIFRFEPDGLNERGLSILQIGPGGAAVIQNAPTSFR